MKMGSSESKGKLDLNTIREKNARLLNFFTDEFGNDLELAPGQKRIFDIVTSRRPRYNHVIACTQYGKSLSIGLGILCSAALGGHKWAIVAPTEKQAMIIMRYVLEHAFDHILFSSRLITDTKLEKLKRERSRKRVVFKGGGEVFVLSADASNKKKAGEALMGYGAPNLAIDESSLINDEIYSKIKRMIGGRKDHFLIEIGNPFKRNHFYKAAHNDTYNHIKIDHHQAIEEGRIPKSVIDQQRDLPDFDVLYKCEFPEDTAVDKEGYTRLLRDGPISRTKNRTVGELKGEPRLGVDIGRGNDKSAYVLRYENYMGILEQNNKSDLMKQAEKIDEYIKDIENLKQQNVFIDDAGVGGGVTDRCRDMGNKVTPMKSSESPQNKERFLNKRAELYWNLKRWFEVDENEVENHERVDDLKYIKYKKKTGTSRLKIKNKQDIKEELGHSPDIPDAMALTFEPLKVEPEIFVI